MKKKMLCVMSNILGGKTFNLMLNDAIAAYCEKEHIEGHYLYLNPEDYARFQPKILNYIPYFVTPATIYFKIKNEIDFEYDYLFIQAMEMLPAFAFEASKHPTVLAHDSTFYLHRNLDLQEKGAPIDKKLSFKERISEKIYIYCMRKVDGFLPLTNYCANSLLHNYCIDHDRFIPLFGGLDLNKWCPRVNDKYKENKYILFVGNDFLRKGGDFLLKVYEKHLQRYCKLIIVSHDEYLNNVNIPYGVEWIKGMDRDELITVFQEAELFVFPSRKEWMGFVNIEASAVGLPLIVTRVGGLSEMVKMNENGYLMPYHATEKEWADKIIDLLLNEKVRGEFGKKSREIAEQKYSLDVFRSKVHRMMDLVYK